jgi:hypothetical protein
VCESNDIWFDVPQEGAASDLCDLLESSEGYVELENGTWSVRAVLDRNPLALGVLLRTVELWVAELGFQAIRFRLDDRWYVMTAFGAPAVGDAHLIS